ncbi:MAG: DUF998 domain-containing protein, partial [Candidatus Dojkabacteria bacterium]
MDKNLEDIKPHHIYFAAVAVFFLAVLIPFFRIGEFYSTVSDFGADYRTNTIFNFLIFLSGIIATVGCIQLCKENFKKYGRVRSIILIASTVCISFIGLFPLGVNEFITGVHHIFTTLLFIGMPICMIFFGTLFYRKKQEIFLILTALGLLDFVQLLIFYSNRQTQAWQWLGIIIVLAFHYVLLRHTPKLEEIKNEFEELE